MAALNELIERVENPELREQIQAAVNKLIKQKKFGLVFEEHLPECTPLYEIPVRKGSKAALKSGKVSDFYTVLKIEGDNAFCLNKDRTETTVYPVSDLVSVAEFGDPIYPYLQPIDSVCKAPESDLWHTLIEADNYHALQLLEYLYAGKVDCIYIDPPYNTGARDWKYNDNYVESADAYRHSKWLSMMKKRLVLAHNILSSKGCIFISIDDNEVYTLKLLCDEIFGTNSFCALIPWRKRTAKSDVPFGVSQDYEYVLCYANKDFKAGIKNISRKYFETDDYKGRPWRYHDLTKQTTIQERPNSNFPMINPKSGDVFPVNPLRSWAITKESFQEYYDSGRIIFPGDYDFLNIKRPVLRYWKDDDEKKAGEDFGISSTSTFLPTEIVGMTQNGTKEIVGIFGDKIFSFPKPLGLIKYLIQIATVKNKNALIVDFFAGSGTTLHAVNLLNAEDGGHRRCIMITNNEVSDAEAKEMTSKGLKPGDPEWDRLGIARYVTWPRTVCSIEGHDINGNPLNGDYISNSNTPIHMADGFKANAAFFKLGFLDKTKVSLGRQFKEMLPTLWMKAGAYGPCPTIREDSPKMLILPENKMAILNDENYFGMFTEELMKYPEIVTVYLVTDYEASFTSMTAVLPGKMTYQLYRDYLDNFRINAERNTR